MRSFLFVLFEIILIATDAAQSSNQGKIAIAVTNEKATVELLKAKDPALVKVAITDNKGIAEFEKIPFGSTNRPHTTITYPGVYIERWHAFRKAV